MYKRKRIFSGWCPKEDIYETQLNSDCRNCPNYVRCLKQKERRIAKRKALIRKKLIVRFITAIFIVLVLCASAQILTSRASNDKSTTDEVSMEKVQVKSTQNNSEPFREIEYIKNFKIANTSNKQESENEENTEEETQTVEENDEIESVSDDSNVEETEGAVISAYEASSTYYYQLSDQDKLYIAKVVYREARGESFEGMVAVAAVVLNRYYSNDQTFDRSSIYSVVTQQNQFASISGVTKDMLDEYPDCMEAVEAACKGWDPTRKMFSEGAKYFYAPGELSETAAKQREGIKTLSIGNHNFHNDFNENY